MEFMLGCNYWASNAGTEMWVNWDEDAIKKDFRILSENGVNTLRVFPIWRDFQPVYPLYTMAGELKEYRLNESDLPQNPYMLDEKMLERFSRFCDLAQEYGLKLIVGLLTGWMSGRLFIPPALFGKNLYTDSVALNFEQKFIEGFVKRMKDKSAIYAWNLGNECNCMSKAENHEEAETWTMVVCNAIRANDSERMIISGMHGINIEGIWRITEQAAHTDMLTTHPYPYFVQYCAKDKFSSYRTLMHATCETKYYSDIGNKPCLVEEIGTLGPTMCDDATAANFLHTNLFSNWVHGSEGVLWWCANEQIMLKTPPYTWNMCETELGMIDRNGNPKPVLLEMKDFANWLSENEVKLPKAKEDAVCIMTEGQSQWGIAYMSYILAKQSGINIRFADGGGELPESDFYMMPSVQSVHPIRSEKFNQLKERVADGATLYISNSESVISEFKELTGVVINDSQTKNECGIVIINGKNVEYAYERKLTITADKADVLCYDENGSPLITSYRYGKGKVIYSNFPVEKNLLDKSDMHLTDQREIYKMIFEEKINTHVVKSDCRYVGITEHYAEDGSVYAVIINYSDLKIEPEISIADGYKYENIKGDIGIIDPFDTVIVKLTK